jgi:hypothetical protein
MKKGSKFLLLSLLFALVAWFVMSWPLPRHLFSGIGYTANNVERYSTRHMMPGDHLQFHYHLWLGTETFSGRVRPFYNVYEFNTGDDEDRRERSHYYLPFSLFFMLGDYLGGPAFGWNLTGWVAIWLTFLFSWLLARRFIKDEYIAVMLALASIIWPYRWITLLEGSPTGLSMMWVPIIYWLLDKMVRDRSIVAGVLAAISIFVSAWGDAHIYLFSALSAPVWCWFCYAWQSRRILPRLDELPGLLKWASGFIVVMGLVLLQAYFMRQGLEGTDVARAGRSLREVSAHSHQLDNIVHFNNARLGRRIYIGGLMLALWGGLYLAALVKIVRKGKSFAIKQWPLLVMPLMLLGVLFLGLGLHNPLGERGWVWLTRLIPPYKLIRQPDKIIGLFPILFSVSLALPIGYLIGQGGKAAKRFRFGLAVVILLVTADYARHIEPGICIMDSRQGAYEAVADDAAARNAVARIIVLPLWPGDSHYSSIYQYFVSLYRIRMINGYGGGVYREDYFKEVFLRYISMNKGYVKDEQLDSLLASGIDYVLLHENAFPEKVSPFSVGHTLISLLNNPRLSLLESDGPIWAFRIESAGVAADQHQYGWLPFAGASRHTELHNTARDPDTEIMQTDDASTDHYLAITHPGQWFALPVSAFHGRNDRQYYWIRSRGKGTLSLRERTEDMNAPAFMDLTIDSSGWSWQRIPYSTMQTVQGGQVAFELTAGAVDMDLGILAYGELGQPEVGDALELPAVCLFHAGYTADDFSEVVIRADYDPDAVILYGPKLPLSAGRYRIEMAFTTDAPAGTRLGEGIIRGTDGSEEDCFEVTAGESAAGTFEHSTNLPFCFGFRYNRQGDLRIQSIQLKMLSDH